MSKISKIGRGALSTDQLFEVKPTNFATILIQLLSFNVFHNCYKHELAIHTSLLKYIHLAYACVELFYVKRVTLEMFS